MKCFKISCITVLMLLQITFSQTVVSPVFPFKDGEVSVQQSNGIESDILLDGTPKQVKKRTMGWITFQTKGVELDKAQKCMVTLYVKRVPSEGKLYFHLLTRDIRKKEM